MSTYETLIAFNPNLDKESLSAQLDSFKATIARSGGTVIAESDLGKKKFAYRVKKFSTGIYHLIYYSAPSSVVPELERSFKHAEEVLKYLTLVLEEKELEHALAALAPAAEPTAAAPKEDD